MYGLNFFLWATASYFQENKDPISEFIVRSVAKKVRWSERKGNASAVEGNWYSNKSNCFFSPTCRLKIPGYVTFGNVCGKRWGFIGKQRRKNKNVPFILVAIGEHAAENTGGGVKIIVFLRPEPAKPLSP